MSTSEGMVSFNNSRGASHIRDKKQWRTQRSKSGCEHYGHRRFIQRIRERHVHHSRRQKNDKDLRIAVKYDDEPIVPKIESAFRGCGNIRGY